MLKLIRLELHTCVCAIHPITSKRKKNINESGVAGCGLIKNGSDSACPIYPVAMGVSGGVVRGNIIYNYGVREWLLVTERGGGTKQDGGRERIKCYPNKMGGGGGGRTSFSHAEGVGTYSFEVI